MVKLNLFFNKINNNVEECLQIIEQHFEQLAAEEIDLIVLLREMLHEQVTAKGKQVICKWVLANFRFLMLRAASSKNVLDLLKDEVDFFAEHIRQIDFTVEEVLIKVDVLQTGNVLLVLKGRVGERLFYFFVSCPKET